MNLKNMIIEQHVKTQYGNMLRFATRKFVGNNALAQEAVQETYAKALENFSTFDLEKANFNHWMKVLLRNTISDIKSIESLRGGNKSLEEAENVPAENSRVDDQQLLDKIKVEIEKEKSPTKREVLYLYFVKGLYPVDICKTVDRMTPENAATIASRFKKDLRQMFGEVA